MKVQLKLGAVWGTIFPEEITLADNEPLEIQCVQGNLEYLQYGDKTYSSVNGIWTIPHEELDSKKAMSVKAKNKERTVFIRGFTVKKLDIDTECKRIDSELAVKCAILENEVQELKDFKQKAVKDIETLCEAYNKLIEELEKIKEELAL